MEILNGIIQPDLTKKWDKRCKLALTGTVNSGTIILTNASQTSITKSGDSLYLGADATEFNATKKIFFVLNGSLVPISDITFVTTYSFTINQTLDSGDEIYILK
jgi:hypothetical protein